MTPSSIGALYDLRAAIPFDGSTNLQEVKAAIDLVDDVASSNSIRIGDLGCGTGWHLCELERRGYNSIFGIDLSLTSLSIASRMCRNTLTTLIHGDVTKWKGEKFFDLITCFNSCIGAVDQDYDKLFFDSVSRLLRTNGIFIMTFMSRNLVPILVGTSHVLYSRTSNLEVSSQVKSVSENRELIIDQSIGEDRMPQESLFLYERGEVEEMLLAAGFSLLTNVFPRNTKNSSPLRFVSVVVAQKR